MELLVGCNGAVMRDAVLALEALQMALDSREVIPGGLVHHSDRGVQYACGDYIGRLEAAGIQTSMSRTGCPYDNAMAERFMKTLKMEEVDEGQYTDLDHARASVGTFIETAYNRQRLHSALAYRSADSIRARSTQIAATGGRIDDCKPTYLARTIRKPLQSGGVHR